MEELIEAITQEVLMKSCIRTHQGVVLKPGPLPKFVFDDEVTTNSPDSYLAIRKHIDRCVDASFSAYFDKNMVEDACEAYFNKKIGSKIDNCQQYHATSTFASTQHIHNTMDGSTGVHAADSTGIGYTKSLANGQTAPTIAGQTVSYLGQIVPPVAGLTASLTTGQTGPLASQTGLSIADCITNESEIVLSPKTESQIGHVDVGKDDDNVLRDGSEIESKVAMHTYQRPYPEHVDSVPYPQGFEVPNFTKFTGEDARTTMEHIGQFIEQCGKAGSNNLLKLKLFPLSLSNFAPTWYSLLTPSSISTWSQMEREFHAYFKDASLMEKRPVDDSSVTCETISVTSMPKTGIVSDPLPVSSIDVDKKKVKSVIIGDPRPKNRIKNAKAEDHKVAKDESFSFQRTKKPKLTFEMLMAKYKKGLAGQRFDNQTSDSKRPRSSRRKRFGQTSKQSEPSTIPTPYKPPVVMPWYPYPMSLYGYSFLYYMPWMHQPRMPFHEEWKESPRTVPNHSSNSKQDRFSQKNRSGGSKVKKVKKVKKVWVRKEAKAPEVVAIKEESQDVHVPTGDAVETTQAKEIEADAVTINIGDLTETAGRSNRKSMASLTDLAGRSDRRLVASLTGPRGRSDQGALEKSGKN
uniref:Retrotransposon protein, putative, Ty3-gypsy subclass n=1 Tax=Oryza sativa subsp. japonica TaxID=39947 RepID=Q2R0E5_ORYSJ|nr:retrotransposon protein, putative, Ty3-gypsy subclass [Oryza sativa Japonica Group]